MRLVGLCFHTNRHAKHELSFAEKNAILSGNPIACKILYSSNTVCLLALRMRCAVDGFGQEYSCSWKAVIQFNLIRHVLIILKLLEEKEAMVCPLSSMAVAAQSNVTPGPSHDASAQTET